MKILLLMACLFLTGCGQKLMVIKTSKGGVNVETTEPYDKEIFEVMKSCPNVEVEIIRRKNHKP